MLVETFTVESNFFYFESKEFESEDDAKSYKAELINQFKSDQAVIKMIKDYQKAEGDINESLDDFCNEEITIEPNYKEHDPMNCYEDFNEI